MTDTNPSDVAEIQEKLENTNISSTAASSGNDANKPSADTDSKPTSTDTNNKAAPSTMTEAKAEEATNTNNVASTAQTQQSSQQQPPAPQQQATSSTTVGNSNASQQKPSTTTSTTTPSGGTESKETEEDLTNLIINYLPPTMSEGTLATLFSPYGLLERCKIVVDLQTLRSRGYGFVKYDNPTSAQRALNALNGYELNGKKLKVAYARKQCKAITNANLYITNIPPHFIDNDLRKLFQDYGKIVECRVLKDQNGQSRGVGFVRMDTHHNAIQALQAMDQYVVDDKHPPLLVKLAQRRVPRRYAQYRNQNQTNQGGMGRQQQRIQKQGVGGKKKGHQKKRNSPNRSYYSPKNNYSGGQGQGQSGGGGMNMNDNMGPSVGGQQGGGNQANRSSPGKGRGYYRPRNQPKGVGGGNQGNYNNRGGGGRGPNQGPPYFTAPMYHTDAPYGQMPASYGQPAYATNIPMTAAALNNPTGVGQGMLSKNNVNQTHEQYQQQYDQSTSTKPTTAAVTNKSSTTTNNVTSSRKPTPFNVLVYNLPKQCTVDHMINIYAKFGPVQSVNIVNSVSAFPNKKGPVGIISYFYFDDAQRAQNETNNLEMTIGKRLQTFFQPPVK